MTKEKITTTNDKCMICEDDECGYESDIYECPMLNKMIEEKKLEYVWCWTEKK